ncbi:protein N-lysine methyltransferase METTL21A-like [Dendronephthya gigantea]|nr:protein N-lysine methyltransferase METTL21A-like [Dendronephthya gigantea]
MFENDSQLIEHLRNSTVLELGAGCGLVGLALSYMGAKYVLLTDMDVCLPTLKINVDKHSCDLKKDSILVMSYTWGEDTKALMKPHGKFNIIVAAEVLYDESDSKLLAYSALQLLAEDGVMFVSMGRNRKGETAFVDVMRENGYSTFEVQKEKLHPKYQDEIIKVIKVIKKIT